jgi:pyrroloquinoline quinone biosynthesis protein D
MDQVSDDRRPVRRATVDFRVLDDLSSVAVDSASGEAHALNPVATAVLERCDGTMTVAEIVDEVVAIFDAPAEQVAADVRAFLEQLAGAGLIEW